MGLYNFQKRFAPFILDGRKSHTIRAERQNPDKPGNTLHLYTGLRCKGTHLLMRVQCTKVEEIQIYRSKAVSIDGALLDASECEQLAQRDGFADLADMMSFWAGRLPFRGHIIHWKAPVVTRHKCPACDGAGIFKSAVCSECRGNGSVVS